MMTNLNNLFDRGMELHYIANTAYPLTPTSVREYAIKGEEAVNAFLAQEYKQINELCLYVHIPFCKTRCKFCEYVVVSGSEAELKDKYLDAVLKEIELYSEIVGNDTRILGFDIGGGTPTELGAARIEKITNKLLNTFNLTDEISWSIETTPYNAIHKFDELKDIRELGFRRLSMGVQTINKDLLRKMEREGDTLLYRRAVEAIRKAGFKQFNVDLMYGFKEQSIEDFESTVEYAVSLFPEYITLYEMRYKLTQIATDAFDVTRAKVNQQYRIAYEILTQNGYKANYGKNTFSRIANDHGTSDYLTHRVINATPYLGLGAGAQSLGLNYLAYNQGAATKSILKYISNIEKGIFPIQDIYQLPEEEMMAKALSVMFYFGFVNLKAFKQRFNKEFINVFEKEIDYLKQWNLAEIDDNQFTVTKNGMDHLSGVIPMFYSERSKNELMTMNIEKVLK
ncbi:coproporphyrinogen-III oxidase family protein [Bacteroides sp. 224]|uniref:coproporphyrinogen-III oxidase family protein n=1 Tax=Bacteroides sp. 224 TaxID=2302936 RepID=UPI0013D685B1|nr:radical SAM protein [Bacteroides sp. 224]NDV67036.1 radical SAM protein [Bacteroides sp. 224]